MGAADVVFEEAFGGSEALRKVVRGTLVAVTKGSLSPDCDEDSVRLCSAAFRSNLDK